MITSRYVEEVARAGGFRPDVVEKVLRLRNILERLDRHPVTSGSWVLKGGTALNLLYLEVPRLSVDIDINYIGEVDVDRMRAARPEFERALAGTPGVELRVHELPLIGEIAPLIAPALEGPDRCTAVFAATDTMAEACYRAAAGMGLTIPDDLSVVGWGDLDFSARLTPPLSTVHQHPYEMGKRAAELVASGVGESFGTVQPVVDRLPTEFTARSSVGPPPSP